MKSTEISLACFATVLFALATLWPVAASAGQTTVAVAANFAIPAQTLVEKFEAQTGHSVRLSIGATGALYAQIRNGAPFDVLMAADVERPRLLEEEGAAVAGSRFTYATGRLVLWSATRDVTDGPATLRADDFRKLAIANPDIAPYGLAAVQTLAALGLRDELAPKLVQGANIGQAHTMVATRNAELGFVAQSLLRDASVATWRVPAELHDPILQDAVLLKRGQGNAAAKAFIAFLKQEETRSLIREFGYD